jgi:hypothetical protein
VAADVAVKVSTYAAVPTAPEDPDPLRNGLGRSPWGSCSA